MPTDGAVIVRTHFLYPGAIFVHPEPHRVTTVLGSCVSVCLWDREKRIGGMNHFLLPLWNGEGLSTPRYGNIAIEKLIDRMISLGCGKEGMIAKIFGGSAMWCTPKGLLTIGERNVALARQILQTQRIPILSSEVGGNAGRKIIFDTGTGQVMLRRSGTVSPAAAVPLSRPGP